MIVFDENKRTEAKFEQDTLHIGVVQIVSYAPRRRFGDADFYALLTSNHSDPVCLHTGLSAIMENVVENGRRCCQSFFWVRVGTSVKTRFCNP